MQASRGKPSCSSLQVQSERAAMLAARNDVPATAKQLLQLADGQPTQSRGSSRQSNLISIAATSLFSQLILAKPN